MSICITLKKKLKQIYEEKNLTEILPYLILK